MNKQDLIDTVPSSTGTSRSVTGEGIDALSGTITAALVKGDTAQFIGLGSFGVDARAARTGRNRATGQELKIPASKSVKFSAGKAFKDAVNSHKRWASQCVRPKLSAEWHAPSYTGR